MKLTYKILVTATTATLAIPAFAQTGSAQQNPSGSASAPGTGAGSDASNTSGTVGTTTQTPDSRNPTFNDTTFRDTTFKDTTYNNTLPGTNPGTANGQMGAGSTQPSSTNSTTRQ